MYVINRIAIGYKRKFSNITSFHPQSFNGSEERNAGRERGGMKRRGAMKRKRCKKRAERNGWQDRGVDVAEQV